MTYKHNEYTLNVNLSFASSCDHLNANLLLNLSLINAMGITPPKTNTYSRSTLALSLISYLTLFHRSSNACKGHFTADHKPHLKGAIQHFEIYIVLITVW